MLPQHHKDLRGLSRQKAMRDVWEISYLNSQAKERLGYPTQKPLDLIYYSQSSKLHQIKVMLFLIHFAAVAQRFMRQKNYNDSGLA